MDNFARVRLKGQPKAQIAPGAVNIRDVYENGLTIEKYKGLSDEDKQKLRDRFFEVFEPEANRRVYPLIKDEKVRALIDASRELLQKYPGEKIIAFGRSPLWFVESAKIIEISAAGEDPTRKLAAERFGYVAFSGRPFASVPFATQKQIADYHEYLKNTGFDPVSIVNRNEKTVIVEYVLTKGIVLSSFLDILMRLADKQGVPQEKLKDKIVLHIIQEDTLKNTAPKFNDRFGVSSVNYQYVDKELIEVLSDSDEFRDSLGVHFPAAEWGVIDPLNEKFARNAPLVSFRIMDYLMKQQNVSSEVKNDGGKGGIDLRALPMAAKRAGPAAGSTGISRQVGQDDIAALNARWQSIQQHLRQGGDMPYREIKEYAVSCGKQGASGELYPVLSYIVDILRIEEESAVITPVELKEILAVI